MRIVVVGATGNHGTSVLEALGRDDTVTSVLGLARRLPRTSFAKTEWARADVVTDDLVSHFRGADAVIHLAWAIQPSHDRETLRRINVDGSQRVFDAVADAGVLALVYASSVGAYSPGPKERAVDESWPTDGIATSFYAVDKAEVERRLDRFEADHPAVRVVRLRPALTFKRDAASGVRRLFAGPFVPTPLLRPSLIPYVPSIKGLRFQAVHSLDLGEAYRLAATTQARGAFNIAAEPVLDPSELARILSAELVPVPRQALRPLVAATWRLHLQPTPPGWLDMALGVPIMETRRARDELGWTPTRSADVAFRELLDGMRENAGLDTPPLSPRTSGRLRLRELSTGVGSRQ
jgi:nucleoside-diphosphate-sugar epimerase